MQYKNILTCGPLLMDIVVNTNVAGSEKLDAQVEKIRNEQGKLKPGGKDEISRDESRQFARAIKGLPVVLTPGGSSLNAVTTLKGMMGEAASVNFLGMVASGPFGDIIEGTMEEAGINLEPKKFVSNPPPETAVSYTLTPPDGSRSYAIYNGNVREVFTPSAIPELEKLVIESDVMMLSGSAWERVSPEMADTMMELRWKHGKELVLSLPVGRLFSEENAHLFRWRLASANVVLANEAELARTYNVGTDYQQALQLLQKDFQKGQLTQEAAAGHWHGSTKQVGFVTFGKEGAYIVTAEEIKKVEPLPDPPGKMYKGGSGDTAFAGFLLGHFNNESHEVCAQMGMELANAKLTHPEPRLPDPLATLKERMPLVAKRILGEEQHPRIQTFATALSNLAT